MMKIICTNVLGIALISLHAIGLCSEAAEPLKFVAEPTQLAEWSIEVSSRLPSQGKNNYGPENLLSGSKAAWVEGVESDDLRPSVCVDAHVCTDARVYRGSAG